MESSRKSTWKHSKRFENKALNFQEKFHKKKSFADLELHLHLLRVVEDCQLIDVMTSISLLIAFLNLNVHCLFYWWSMSNKIFSQVFSQFRLENISSKNDLWGACWLLNVTIVVDDAFGAVLVFKRTESCNLFLRNVNWRSKDDPLNRSKVRRCCQRTSIAEK